MTYHLHILYNILSSNSTIQHYIVRAAVSVVEQDSIQLRIFHEDDAPLERGHFHVIKFFSVKNAVVRFA